MDCAPGVERLTVFLSPLSREETEYLKAPERHVSLPDFVAEVMRRKLLRRTQRQKGTLSLPDLSDIETRCTSAYAEMKHAWRFDRVLVNHDGEDSDHWSASGYPLADARRTLLAFVDLLEGREPAEAERWTEDLLP
jgi:guanylate kinase